MFKNRIFQAAAAFLAVSFIVFAATLASGYPDTVKKGVFLGILLAVFNCAVSCASLNWAFKKSDKIFFGALFGSMFWKLLVLAAAAYYLFTANAGINPVTALVTLALMTLLFNILETGFLRKATVLRAN